MFLVLYSIFYARNVNNNVKSFTTCCDFSVMSMSAFTHGVIFVTEFETLAKGHLDTEDTTSM